MEENPKPEDDKDIKIYSVKNIDRSNMKEEEEIKCEPCDIIVEKKEDLMIHDKSMHSPSSIKNKTQIKSEDRQ